MLPKTSATCILSFVFQTIFVWQRVDSMKWSFIVQNHQPLRRNAIWWTVNQQIDWPRSKIACIKICTCHMYCCRWTVLVLLYFTLSIGFVACWVGWKPALFTASYTELVSTIHLSRSLETHAPKKQFHPFRIQRKSISSATTCRDWWGSARL